MKNPTRFLLALLGCCSCISALAGVSVSLDRDHAALGERVQLLLQSDGDADGAPDIGPLSRDFDVLGSSHSSSMQIVNGHSSSQVQLRLVLSPKHAGTLTIPPLQWGTQHTQELALTVDASTAGNEAASAPDSSATVFLTATQDQTSSYVQAAVVLTVKLYAATQVSQASLDMPGNADILVKQLGSDRQTSESHNGHDYQVVERKYVLIPQRSGKISLKGPTLNAQVQDPGAGDAFDLNSFFGKAFGSASFGAMMGPARQVHMSAKAIELNVLARPATADGANWLPAQELQLEESWRPENGALHVGDPLTRHIHLASTGLTGAQLPDLGALMSVPEGVKRYPDQPTIADSLHGSTVQGSRDQDIALVASKPGQLVLPALQLNWWDTIHHVMRQASLPARTLDILPASGEPISPPPPSPATASSPEPGATTPGAPSVQGSAPLEAGALARNLTLWQWGTLALSLSLLAALIALWRLRRRTDGVASASAAPSMPRTEPTSADAGTHVKRLQQACNDNDPQAARRHLMAWAATIWPEAPPRGPNELAQRWAAGRFTEPLSALDRACYTGAAWTGATLAQAIATSPIARAASEAKPAIPDLYA